MKTLALALIGFGNVGKAFAQLLQRKQEEILRDYDLSFKVTGIATARHGKAINPDGIDLTQALAILDNHQSLSSLSTLPTPDSMLDFIDICPADALLENTPVNHKTGQPAIDHLRRALERNMHAITANKGPVAHAYHELTQLAAVKNRRFLFESTVMDGAPIFSLFRGPLPVAQLQSFHGILNSCTNYIIGRMEEGDTFEQAVINAQSIGITETDPSADIDGWDAAIKVCALATVLMNVPLIPDQVDRQGIRQITPQMIADAREQGLRWKLVCSAVREGKMVKTKVSPQTVAPKSPLYGINGTSSYVQFDMDVLPGLGIVESDPGPDTTAYGLLADLINTQR